MTSEETEKTSEPGSELAKRRARLEALKAKRAGASPELEEPSPAAAETDDFVADQNPFADAGLGAGPGAGAFGGLAGRRGGGGGRARKPGGGDAMGGGRRKILRKVYNVLTQTPEDEHGLVDETPFTEAGVSRLVEQLNNRSKDEGAPGAQVATKILKYLQPIDDDDTTASGVSRQKLQTIARQVESLRRQAVAKTEDPF